MDEYKNDPTKFHGPIEDHICRCSVVSHHNGGLKRVAIIDERTCDELRLKK